ncbi:hypothetical protein [Kitasatospora sp. NPDC057015]|uniref:hypothetical protein n=1 Tax=Kitasatospora sp. NPDC057015 TaxID=3346001 RepID=UPI003640F49E
MSTRPADDATGPGLPVGPAHPVAGEAGPGDPPPPESLLRRGGPLGPGAGGDPGERPLDACLADYWQGTFTLRDSPQEPAAAPAHAGLGPSGVTVRGRDLATVLDRAYRAFTA